MGAPTDVDGLGVTEATALAETAEAEFMYAFETGAPRSARSALGMAAVRLGGGVVLAMGADPTGGYWNKALGFGITEPVTDDLVAAVLDVYRASGSAAAVLQLAPSVLPDDWDDICARHGIVPGSVWAKLLRHAGVPVAPASTDLRVDRLRPGDVDAGQIGGVRPLHFYASQSGAETLDQGEGGGNPFASALIELLGRPTITFERFLR